LTAFSFVFDA